jgi:hypothetical protein
MQFYTFFCQVLQKICVDCCTEISDSICSPSIYLLEEFVLRKVALDDKESSWWGGSVVEWVSERVVCPWGLRFKSLCQQKEQITFSSNISNHIHWGNSPVCDFDFNLPWIILRLWRNQSFLHQATEEEWTTQGRSDPSTQMEIMDTKNKPPLK